MASSFSTLLIALLFFTVAPEKTWHVGTWETNGQGDFFLITLDEEGYAYFEKDGTLLGGKDIIRKGKKVCLKYEINYKESPVTLDMYLLDNETGEEQDRIFGIIEFHGKKKMKMRLEFNSTKGRPNSFRSSKTMYMRKMN